MSAGRRGWAENLWRSAHAWAMLESTDEGVLSLDLQGRVTFVNASGSRMLGYEPQEILGANLHTLIHHTHPDGSPYPEEACPVYRAFRTGQGCRVADEVFWRKDGSSFPVEYSSHPIIEEEAVAGAVVTFIDITERKKAERALKASEERYRSLALSTSQIVWRTNAEGEVATQLPTWQTYTGQSKEDILGYGWLEALHPDDRERIAQLWSEAVTTRSPYETEYRVRRHDGVYRCFAARGVPVLEEDSRIREWIGTCTDITEKKEADEEIRTRAGQQAAIADLGLRAVQEADLQVLMDEATALVARTLKVEYCKVLQPLPDSDDLLLQAGVGWKEGLVGRVTVGGGLDSQAGYALFSGEPIIVEDLRKEKRFNEPPLLHDHGVVSGMSTIIQGRDRPFGVLGAHTTRQRTFTEDDLNFLQAVANVLSTAVERKQAEEKMREVREAERRRMARDLHDGVLQDLSYAMRSIDAARRKSKNEDLTAELEREIELLSHSIQGVRDAIYDLRLEESRARPFVERLESIIEQSRQRSEECEIELDVKDGFSEHLIEGPKTELLRIVQETLVNARRHSEARHIRVAVGASGGKLWAEVSDDGRGFDPAEASDAGGMGLKGINERARLLKGNLEIESKPDRGTKVRFEAALEKAQEEPEKETRILLVEDHASFRQAAASMLESEPGLAVVAQAGSLAEARDMLDEIDVAIIDLGLPDGYGGDLIKELRARNRQAQALVLTANLDWSELARAVENGAAGVLHKSADIDEVVEAVRRVTAGESLLSLEEIVELLRVAGAQREQEYEARQAIASLTPREKEVLQALAEGLDSQGIAERLNISVKTERNHMMSILAKFGVHSQLQALVFALRYGVVDVR